MEERWVTTETGNHIHINSKGVPDKGNPDIIAALKKSSGGGKTGSSKTAKSASKKVGVRNVISNRKKFEAAYKNIQFGGVGDLYEWRGLRDNIADYEKRLSDPKGKMSAENRQTMKNKLAEFKRLKLRIEKQGQLSKFEKMEKEAIDAAKELCASADEYRKKNPHYPVYQGEADARRFLKQVNKESHSPLKFE